MFFLVDMESDEPVAAALTMDKIYGRVLAHFRKVARAMVTQVAYWGDAVAMGNGYYFIRKDNIYELRVLSISPGFIYNGYETVALSSLKMSSLDAEALKDPDFLKEISS